MKTKVTATINHYTDTFNRPACAVDIRRDVPCQTGNDLRAYYARGKENEEHTDELKVNLQKISMKKARLSLTKKIKRLEEQLANEREFLDALNKV